MKKIFLMLVLGLVMGDSAFAENPGRLLLDCQDPLHSRQVKVQRMGPIAAPRSASDLYEISFTYPYIDHTFTYLIEGVRKGRKDGKLAGRDVLYGEFVAYTSADTSRFKIPSHSAILEPRKSIEMAVTSTSDKANPEVNTQVVVYQDGVGEKIFHLGNHQSEKMSPMDKIRVIEIKPGLICPGLSNFIAQTYRDQTSRNVAQTK